MVQHDHVKAGAGQRVRNARIDPVELRVRKKTVQHEDRTAFAHRAIGEGRSIEALKFAVSHAAHASQCARQSEQRPRRARCRAVDAATPSLCVTSAEPKRWFRWAGAAAIVSALAAVAADVAAISLADGSFLATSVSATAIGEHAWFVDAAIYLTGAAVGAIAFALHHWNLGQGRYRFGIFCLAALALTMFLLAGWDAYNPEQVPDFGFHMMLVYGLSGLFPLAALSLTRSLSKVHRFWGRFSIVLAVLWLICGPIYAVTPEDFEGLFQRIAFLMMLVWVAGVGVMLIRIAASCAGAGVDPEPEGA